MASEEHVMPLDKVMTIVTILGDQIVREMRSLASEESHPSNNPDTMDDKITRSRELVKGLRAIREQYEDLMTGTSVK